MVLSGNLVHCSVGSNFVPLYLDGAVQLHRQNGTIRVADTPIRRYSRRMLNYEDMSLYDYVCLVDRDEKTCPYAIPRPVPHRNYQPSDPIHHEMYCRDMITLFHPWRESPAELLPPAATWAALFDVFIERSPYAPEMIKREVSRFRARQQHTPDDPNHGSDNLHEVDLMSDASDLNDENAIADPQPGLGLHGRHREEWMMALARYFDNDLQSSISGVSQSSRYTMAITHTHGTSTHSVIRITNVPSVNS